MQIQCPEKLFEHFASTLEKLKNMHSREQGQSRETKHLDIFLGFENTEKLTEHVAFNYSMILDNSIKNLCRVIGFVDALFLIFSLVGSDEIVRAT